jgi:hypothetical protein
VKLENVAQAESALLRFIPIRFVPKLPELETGFTGFRGLQDFDRGNPVHPANLDKPVQFPRNLATNRIGTV